MAGEEDTDRIRKLMLDRKKAEESFKEAAKKIEKEYEVKPKRYIESTGDDDTSLKFIGLLTQEQKLKSKVYQSLELKKKLKAQEREAQKRKLEKTRKKNLKMLSFSRDEEKSEEEEEIRQPRKMLKKDPTVNTEFLPDADREQKEKELRQQIHKEWLEKQEKIKQENITVMYCYYDGSGQRREMTIQKGLTIGEFLSKARSEFRELRNSMVDQLMFIKEDLIIPHHFTFYDLIESKARGKSGPLFLFDIRDDVRLIQDTRVEKEESHPAKIVERHWYDHNKHIFPASRWEIFDPTSQHSEYSIHDRLRKH